MAEKRRGWGTSCFRLSAVATLFGAALAASVPALATEGGLGRVVPGTVLQSKAGIVPDVPILALNLTYVYADLNTGGSARSPIAGEIAFGLDAKASFTTATLLKVWDTGPGQWNFASQVSVPYMSGRTSATVSVAGTSFGVTDKDAGLFDLTIVPLIAGYHFSATEHMALSVGIFPPTGNYESGKLATTSLNYWTFAPGVAYTKLVPESGLEFTGSATVQFNTTNTATNYRSAPLLTADALAMKALDKGFGVGLTASWVTQLADDTGPLAKSLNGYRGSSLGIGPVASYTALLGGKLPLDFSLRWVPIVYSKNRLEGNTFTFTFSMPIP